MGSISEQRTERKEFVDLKIEQQKIPSVSNRLKKILKASLISMSLEFQKERGKKGGTGEVFGGKMAEISPNLAKIINLQIRDAK